MISLVSTLECKYLRHLDFVSRDSRLDLNYLRHWNFELVQYSSRMSNLSQIGSFSWAKFRYISVKYHLIKSFRSRYFLTSRELISNMPNHTFTSTVSFCQVCSFRSHQVRCLIFLCKKCDMTHA